MFQRHRGRKFLKYCIEGKKETRYHVIIYVNTTLPVFPHRSRYLKWQNPNPQICMQFWWAYKTKTNPPHMARIWDEIWHIFTFALKQCLKPPNLLTIVILKCRIILKNIISSTVFSRSPVWFGPFTVLMDLLVPQAKVFEIPDGGNEKPEDTDNSMFSPPRSLKALGWDRWLQCR